jgi:hypothetical protein
MIIVKGQCRANNLKGKEVRIYFTPPFMLKTFFSSFYFFKYLTPPLRAHRLPLAPLAAPVPFLPSLYLYHPFSP